MLFVCSINMDNSFEDGSELQQLLQQVATTVRGCFIGKYGQPSPHLSQAHAGYIRDCKGNDVGYWEFQGTAQDDQDDERFTLTEAHRLDALQDNEKDKRAAEARGKTTRL